MFDVLSLQQFEILAKENNNVVVYKEIANDRLTPTNIYLAIQNYAKDITLLESYPNEGVAGRFSHLCFDPILSVSAIAGEVTITEVDKVTTKLADPFTVLRRIRKELSCTALNPLCKFAGGLVGFMAYDAIGYIEDISASHEKDKDLPDILFRYYKNHITFDHQSGKVMLATVVQINAHSELTDIYQTALQSLNTLETKLQQPARSANFAVSTIAAGIDAANISVDADDAEYCAMVERAKQHIVDGNIFQVVPSRKFSMPICVAPFNVYRALRFINPAPHMFYFNINDIAIAGSSPEILVNVDNNKIVVRPLAGTRPRGKQYSDAEMEADLLTDEKEIAEHMMLVDLARNDIGRVAVPGTVEVERLTEIEYYSRVMHISSTVVGELSSDKDVFDVLQSCFTAGTLSGAPKVRAMQIIDELEKSNRGLYGGVVCGIDGVGNIDSAIAIRMAIIKDGVASVRAGAGIVYDSDPQKEAKETRHKANAVLEGIILAQEIKE